MAIMACWPTFTFIGLQSKSEGKRGRYWFWTEHVQNYAITSSSNLLLWEAHPRSKVDCFGLNTDLHLGWFNRLQHWLDLCVDWICTFYAFLSLDFQILTFFCVFSMPTMRQSFFVRYAMYMGQHKLKYDGNNCKVFSQTSCLARVPIPQRATVPQTTCQHLIGELGSSQPMLSSSPG